MAGVRKNREYYTHWQWNNIIGVVFLSIHMTSLRPDAQPEAVCGPLYTYDVSKSRFGRPRLGRSYRAHDLPEAK